MGITLCNILGTIETLFKTLTLSKEKCKLLPKLKRQKKTQNKTKIITTTATATNQPTSI